MIAVAAAFLLEVVQTRVRPMENRFIVSEELKQQETIMYPDLLTGIYNCTETEKGLKVVSTDPQMHFSLDGESAISNVSFYFTKPTEEELTIQVFYPDEGGGYSESHSVIELCPKGSESFYIEIPEAEYHDLRVDIDGNVIPLKTICTGNIKAERVLQQAPMNPLRIAATAVLVFAVLFWLSRRNSQAENREQGKVQEIIKRSGEYKAIRFIRQRKELLLYLLFVVVALTEGMIYAFKVPFGQVPDEMTHYEMIEEEFGTTGFVGELNNVVYLSGGLYKLPFHADVKVDQEAVANISQIHYSNKLSLGSFHPKITIFRHLPSGIGYYLGIALDLPIIWSAYLAEIFTVVFFVGMGLLTLRTVPIKKDVFAFCMFIPETLQQCTSVNYDSVLIPCSFLLFAYILKIYYSGQTIKWKQISIIAILSFVVTIIKPPYGLIALSIFIIPVHQYSLRIGKKIECASLLKKYWYVFAILFVSVAAAGIYVLRNQYHVKLILSDILDFPQFLSLMGRTYDQYGYYYVTGMVGYFGWLDSHVTDMFIVISLMMLTYLNCSSREADQTLKTGKRVWLFLVFLATVLFSFTALQGYSYSYLGWDTSVGLSSFISYIPKLNAVLGYQGRYLIPCLPVILIALSGGIRRKSTKIYWGFQIAYYTLALLNIISILDARYWIS